MMIYLLNKMLTTRLALTSHQSRVRAQEGDRLRQRALRVGLDARHTQIAPCHPAMLHLREGDRAPSTGREGRRRRAVLLHVGRVVASGKHAVGQWPYVVRSDECAPRVAKHRASVP